MTRFVYFAYGSNMLTQRLAARCASAAVIGPARLADHHVTYCLASEDGSAKAGLLPKADATAWGVLFWVATAEIGVLDGFEGAPDVYRREEVTVKRIDSDEDLVAVTYLPQPRFLVENGRPYAWYRALCVGGARQHQLDLDRVAGLAGEDVLDMPPPDAPAWEGRAHALSALKAAGLSMPRGGL